VFLVSLVISKRSMYVCHAKTGKHENEAIGAKVQCSLYQTSIKFGLKGLKIELVRYWSDCIDNLNLHFLSNHIIESSF
jgi:hypothetical protein